MSEGFEGLEAWKKACRFVVDVYRAFKICWGFGITRRRVTAHFIYLKFFEYVRVADRQYPGQ